MKAAPDSLIGDFAQTRAALAKISSYTRGLFGVGAVLIGVLFVSQRLLGKSAVPALVMFVAQSLATLALFATRDRPKIGAAIAIATAFVIEATTLLAFGPFSGVGMLVALSVVIAVAHFGRWPGLVTLLLSALLIVGVGSAVTVGMPQAAPNPDLSHATTWLRTAAITLSLGVFVWLALDLLLGSLHRAAKEAVAAQRLEAEARREQAATAKALARAHELETIGRLAGGVAHDFNNALTVILAGASELAQQSLSTEAKSIARDIESAANAAAATTSQLVIFGRSHSRRESTCDPTSSLNASLKNLQRLLPEDIELAVELEPTRRVPLGAGELLQVVVNLVLNARDACPSGGRIRLTVKSEEPGTLVRVEDSGSGMDDETRARLFEPFFTTKENRGTGLGLPMVRGTVTRVGGSIDVESSSGRGTTISIRLPSASSESASASPVAPSVAPGPALTGRSVLVVEDDPIIRRMMGQILTQAGAHVREADSVRSALELLKSGVSFDVLCTDGILGDGTALAVIEDFSNRHPAAAVLLCSGHLPAELDSRGLSQLEHDRLPKPFTGSELVRAVKRLAS